MNENIQHEFFIWEENKNIQLQNNNCKQEENDNCFIIKETKTDLTQNDWRNITNPKLRRKLRKKITDRARYIANKDKLNAQSKDWRNSNKDKIKAYSKLKHIKDKRKAWMKAWREANKDRVKLQNKNWREANKDRIKLQKKEWRKTNKDYINNRLKNRLRVRVCHALKNNQKAGSAVRDLGCTTEELKQYLESKFQSGMTWDNWSIDGWHIDHIKPLASFDLTDRQQFLEACHYTNLQPLWAKDNIIKSDKLI